MSEVGETSFEIIEKEKDEFPVSMMCRVLEVSRAGYYAWREREPSERAKKNVELAAEIVDIHQESRGTYGSPRVHVELRERGFEVSRKRVEKQMREQGLEGRRRPRYRRTTDSNHDEPIAPNIVAREFTVDEPDRVWVADITYIWTLQGWMYLATIASLQQVARRKLDELVRRNPTRRDLYDKLEALIDDYNAGSHNVQESFEAMRSFIEGLSEEEERHVKEGLTEEQLAIFDLLVKPSVELTKADRQQVKTLARDLLDQLKASKFVLDWRNKARAKAGVRTTIQTVLDALPKVYSDELYEEKCSQIYEHCYESYFGDGASKYAGTPAVQ